MSQIPPLEPVQPKSALSHKNRNSRMRLANPVELTEAEVDAISGGILTGADGSGLREWVYRRDQIAPK